MKICLLIKKFDNPNGITRCALGLQEADPRFLVHQYPKKIIGNGSLGKVSRYTIDQVLDAVDLTTIDADILLPMTPLEAFPIFIAGRKPDGVIIFDLIHWMSWRDKSSYLYRLYSYIFRRYDVAAYKYSTKVFCVTDYVQRQLFEKFGARHDLKVVTPGLTDSFIQSAAKAAENNRKIRELSKRQLSVLMVPGALTPDEGIEGTIAALGIIRKKYDDWKITLTLVASRRLEMFPTLLSNANSLGIDLDLSISPKDSQLLALYASSDLFVHAGNDDWFHYTPLEAIACGVPTVFATDLSSIGYFEGCVFNAKFNDPLTISNAIERASFDPGLRSTILSEGQKLVREKSMKNAASQIHKALERS